MGKGYYLRQIRRSDRRTEVQISGVGQLLLHDKLDKRRLSRTVVADECNTLSACNSKVKLRKELLFTEAL